MTSPTRAFQGADPGRLDRDAVVAALADRYTVAPGPSRTVRERELDTFDRRLRAAGLRLEHHVEPRSRRIVLRQHGTLDGMPDRTSHGAADRVTAVRVLADLDWPAYAGTLPAGLVRDTVAPVAGIRALTVVSDQRRSRLLLDLLNRDGKTVVRVELDDPSTGSFPPGLATVHGLRGYDEHADRVARLLAEVGLLPVPTSVPRADDGVVSPSPGPGPDAPAVALLRVSLAGFLATMRATLPGVLADVDTEFLHDFRVALRRTRSTLRLARPVLPEGFCDEWEPAFRWLGALTTPVRDLDVYELGLPSMAGWLVAADPTDLDPFARHLALRREAARQEMVRGLRSARFRRLLARWEVALAALGEGEGEGDGDRDRAGAQESTSAGELGARSVARARRRVVRDGCAISGASPAEDLHRLRGRCKELRYALEVFAPVLTAGVARRAINDLKDLQDVLGRFQDAEVQRHALREFADEMLVAGVRAAALLALGELIAHLDAEQGRARREFDDTFARFVGSSGTATRDRLGGGT